MGLIDQMQSVADRAAEVFTQHGVTLTLGGEPTFVPVDPSGPEWSVTALGPTKLTYAYALADSLKAQALPAAVDFYAPGKLYPGELNPRWAIILIWNTDETPLVPALARPLPSGSIDSESFEALRHALLTEIALDGSWLRGIDPSDSDSAIWILPLDHAEGCFTTENWGIGNEIELLQTDGPAGLRLPLHLLSPDLHGRALTLEIRNGALLIFLPPLLQAGFLALMEACAASLHRCNIGGVRFAGHLPSDDLQCWTKLGIASDPGVLEINLPPCRTWLEYHCWLEVLDSAASAAGLRSFKQSNPEEQLGTGGGNHLLFGGPTLESHPFFTRPRWVTSMLRYWQHHPSLAYLFTGQYVGASSQAPRPDEGGAEHYDLEMAYQFLEHLPAGDHRYLISETLRHLHADGSGNTHRSEISFDKFWNVSFDGGCRGLIEFRAIESFPRSEWMSAIGLLWYCLAARLLDEPFLAPLTDHGTHLHDRYFLPSGLVEDFKMVLFDLSMAGYNLPRQPFDEIIEWRCPVMLETPSGLTIRRALESWPLLCETPLEGGSTSRFVDTSVERLEFSAHPSFKGEVFVQGRPLPLSQLPGGRIGAGIRYRRTALSPSLHPGMAVQLPLYVAVGGDGEGWRLDSHRRKFEPCTLADLPKYGPICKKLRPNLLTYDLRLP